MSWIQENKFVAGVAGVTAVLAGGIFFFGNSQGNQYGEKVTAYEQLKGDYRKLQQSKPFPSAQNLQGRKENIAKYEELIGDVRGTFEGFKAEKLEAITPEQFSNMRVAMDKDLRAAFGESGTTLPEGTAFGFEKYTSESAKSGATAMLKYQLDAVQWLLTRLATAKPAELNGILREPLAEETGRAAAAPQSAGRGGNKRARRTTQAATPAKEAYTLMPMEIAFTGTESSLREFLKAMVNSEEYFFAIRALRIRNEKQVPPSVKDAGFPAGGGGEAAPAPGENDPFAGIALPGADAEGSPGEGGDGGAAPAPAPAPVAKPAAGKGDRILKQVLGGEKLHVFIRFDIVFIKGEPGGEEPAPAKPRP